MTPAQVKAAETIKSARLAAGLTQAAAANLIDRTDRWWRMVEAGQIRMPPTLWELWLLKAKRS